MSRFRTKASRKRRCLGWCGKKFLSTGPGHRFCPECKRKKEDRECGQAKVAQVNERDLFWQF